MYKCGHCGVRTESKRRPNCNPADHPFVPIEIAVVHVWEWDGKRRRLLCTGEPPLLSAIAVGTPMGSTCIRCRKVLEQREESKKTQEIQDLKGSGKSDTIPEATTKS